LATYLPDLEGSRFTDARVQLRVVYAALEQECIVMDTTRHNPPELFDSRAYGFSQIVIAPASGRLIHLSGQVAWDANRNIIGADDLGAQVIQSLRNIEIALRHVGADLSHVVALRLYIKQSHIAQGEAISSGLHEVFGEALPCATWIGVPSLAHPDFLIEIEPTVVAP
jgi:2-iminobutanoate/2-iminopropanoate deaminase